MDMAEMVHRWTREEVLALPEDGNRYELFDGELLVTRRRLGRIRSPLCGFSSQLLHM